MPWRRFEIWRVPVARLIKMRDLLWMTVFSCLQHTWHHHVNSSLSIMTYYYLKREVTVKSCTSQLINAEDMRSTRFVATGGYPSIPCASSSKYDALKSCQYLVKGFARVFKPTALASDTKAFMPQNPIRPAAIFRLGITPTVKPNFSTCKCASMPILQK